MEDKNYPWELLNSTVLMVPEEIIAYHIYKATYYQKSKQEKKSQKELDTISKKTKESEDKECLKK